VWAQPGEQPLAIAGQELLVDAARQPFPVVGEQRALYPVHHGVGARQVMAVDLQTDVLLDKVEFVQAGRVCLGQEHVPGPFSRARPERQRLGEGALEGDLGRDRMGGMVMVGGDLEGQLAAGAQRPGQPGEQRFVPVDPVEGGVGEHHVVFAPVKGADVAPLEADAVSVVGTAVFQHRGRPVHTQGLRRFQLTV